MDLLEKKKKEIQVMSTKPQVYEFPLRPRVNCIWWGVPEVAFGMFQGPVSLCSVAFAGGSGLDPVESYQS
jgi:hypothetical protein